MQLNGVPTNTGAKPIHIAAAKEMENSAKALARAIGIPFAETLPPRKAEGLSLVLDDEGLALAGGGMTIRGDYSRLSNRIRRANLNKELLVRAAKMREATKPLRAFDGTAGLGDDSFLLAAAGFTVTLCERNPIIYALLCDTLERAKKDPSLSVIAERMNAVEGDFIEAIKHINGLVDVVFLDPMFPKTSKSANAKKKLQMLQMLEVPCEDEQALLDAALAACPRKVIIKRPVKGPYFAGRKPDYSLSGKAIRYDCIVLSANHPQ